MDGRRCRAAVSAIFSRCASLLPLSWLCLLLAVPVRPAAAAATVVAYDFEDGGGGFLNAPALTAPHLSASAWQDADGTLGASSGNPGKAVTAKHFNNGNTFSLTLLVAPGYSLDLNGYGFDHRVSSTGPNLWTLSVAGTQVASGTTVAGGFTAAGGNFATSGLTGAVTIGLYATGASSSAGTWRIDNFQLQGNTAPVPAPLPPSVLLLAGALLCLPRRRRR